MSHVMCHVSRVTCHMSRVTCHVSHVTCHIFLFIFFRQSGKVYRWRVCYQRGLPRLVLIISPQEINDVQLMAPLVSHGLSYRAQCILSVDIVRRQFELLG